MFVKGEPVKVTKTQGEGIKMITVDPIERVKKDYRGQNYGEYGSSAMVIW